MLATTSESGSDYPRRVPDTRASVEEDGTSTSLAPNQVSSVHPAVSGGDARADRVGIGMLIGIAVGMAIETAIPHHCSGVCGGGAISTLGIGILGGAVVGGLVGWLWPK
jgi:hypothetical protein